MAKDLNERCEEAILALTQEIQELKEEYKGNQREIAFFSRNRMQLSREKQDEHFIPVMKNIKTKLAECEKEIKLFKQITGMEMTKYLKKKEKESENKVLYNHKLEGQCQILSFEVEFKTAESQPGKEPSLCEVTQVSIHMDCMDHPDLVKVAERTQTSMDLLGFFRVLSKYADWYEFRRNTFTHYKEKYPAAVGLPQGPSANYMVLTNPDLPECQLILVWQIFVNEEGTVIPILDLLPKIPKQATAETGGLEDAGLAFRNLIQVFGIQGSIENIIQSFCVQKDKP